MFDCYIFNGDLTRLIKGAKYRLVEKGNKCGIVFGKNKHIPFVLDLTNHSENLLRVDYNIDSYYFIFPNKFDNHFSTRIQHKTDTIEISLSTRLIIAINGELISEQNVENLTYSHFETFNNFCIVYFKGERNFVVVIKNKEVVFSSYYDEVNVEKNERFFMCRLYDFLNHGRVCRISENECEEYTAYLDEKELDLQEEFIPFVFLDCLKAENFKYCNTLLSEEIKFDKENDIKKFFPEFNYFYPISKYEFILIKKNTLAGIFKFNIENNKINNIIVH